MPIEHLELPRLITDPSVQKVNSEKVVFACAIDCSIFVAVLEEKISFIAVRQIVIEGKDGIETEWRDAIEKSKSR